MKKMPVLFIAIFCCILTSCAQNHKMRCGLELVTCKTQTVLGKNIGYVVEIKNTSDKKVDGVEWEALFYTRFGDLKGKKKGNWTSGNFIKPKGKSESFLEVESSFIDGADDVFIVVKKVHYTDGSTCK